MPRFRCGVDLGLGGMLSTFSASCNFISLTSPVPSLFITFLCYQFPSVVRTHCATRRRRLPLNALLSTSDYDPVLRESSTDISFSRSTVKEMEMHKHPKACLPVFVFCCQQSTKWYPRRFTGLQVVATNASSVIFTGALIMAS